jgi:EAL domain-containing protein (putative c-di-GMP-specific phosphodiesterase class I)
MTGADGRRVLILDDDEAIGATIAMIARGAGLDAVAFRDPAAFLDAIDRKTPSHIVLDLVMPGIDGIEILRRLAAAGCPAAVIIISGLGPRVLDAARRLAQQQGLNLVGVMPKPFTVADMRGLFTGGTRHVGFALPPSAMAPEIGHGALRQALAEGEVSVVFQPKIACATGAAVGFEALAQWCRPDGRRIPTESFVALAERSDLIGPLTEQVVDTALAWLGNGVPRAMTLAINFSPLSLDDMSTVGALVARCDAHGIEPHRLVLEMTESAAMRDPVATLGVLTRLRVRGFRVSIDDFGIGYSSIAHLARLPFSELKIDRSFVRGIATGSENRSIARAMVGLGHSLGLTVAAEGVEDAATLAFLAEIGCDHAQGYFIAPPLDAVAARRWAMEATGGSRAEPARQFGPD